MNVIPWDADHTLVGPRCVYCGSAFLDEHECHAIDGDEW